MSDSVAREVWDYLQHLAISFEEDARRGGWIFTFLDGRVHLAQLDEGYWKVTAETLTGVIRWDATFSNAPVNLIAAAVAEAC